MKILLHACCGPCATYPTKILKEKDFKVYGFFYNPNVHPYQEYQKRLAGFQSFAEQADIPALIKDDYALEEFLRRVSYRESNRCQYCYHMRLEEAARYAKNGKFDYFTSSLLISPFQDHDLICMIGKDLGEKYGVPFYEQDFRPGYKESVFLSKEMGLYRQQYCGCIYSEKDRYCKK